MPKRKTAAGKSRGKRRGERAARPGAATSRTRAIEATLADIAHEIRTPLTGILALGELLTTSELGERERGWAAAIKSTAEHLALLTSLIVDAARADARAWCAARAQPSAPFRRHGRGLASAPRRPRALRPRSTCRASCPRR
jgi:signal transduction histidine kinase